MQRTWPAPFRYVILAAIFILFAALLWYVRSLLQPLLVAAVIAYALSPAVRLLMTRFRLGRRVSATIVYFAAVIMVLVLVGTLVPVMLDQFQAIQNDVQSALVDLQSVLATPVQFGLFRLDLRLLAPSLAILLYRGPIVPQPSQALRFLEMTSRGIVWTVIIMVIVYYVMTEWDELRQWLIGIAPPSEQGDLRQLYHRVRDVWAQYLLGQVRLMIILGFIYSAGWAFIGLPGALALGLLAGLMNLIPEVGPAAVGALATLVAYLEGSRVLGWLPSIWFAGLTLGVYLLINAFKSVWLQPRILGRSVLLHEGLVFVAIVAALMLSGILGVLVVVPVLASAIIVGKYVRRRLLGQPAFDEEATIPAPKESRQPEPNRPEAGSPAPTTTKKSTE